MPNSQPIVSPADVRSKSQEGSSSPMGVAAQSNAGVRPRLPPPAYLKRGRSYHNLSSSSNSLIFCKSPPPPPPFRRTMSKGALQQDGHHRSLLNSSSLSLNNNNGIIPTSNVFVPVTATNDIVPAAVISTMSTTNKQRQPSLKHRSSRRITKKTPICRPLFRRDQRLIPSPQQGQDEVRQRNLLQGQLDPRILGREPRKLLR